MHAVCRKLRNSTSFPGFSGRVEENPGREVGRNGSRSVMMIILVYLSFSKSTEIVQGFNTENYVDMPAWNRLLGLFKNRYTGILRWL